MRTTVTLDPDVERLLKDEAHKRGASFKVALNEAVRRAFRNPAAPAGKRKRFVVKPLSMGPPLIDLTHVNRVLDEWDVDEYLKLEKRLQSELPRKKK